MATENAKMNAKFRAMLKQDGYNSTGWKVQYVGSVLCAGCKRFDVSFAEVMQAKRIAEELWTQAGRNVHFSVTDHYGALINWTF